MKLAYVFVEHPIHHLDHTFTYCADGYTLTRGMRVQVPFGSKTIVGFVEKVEDISDEEVRRFPYTLKPIISQIDQFPLLNEELYELGNWMAQRYIAPKISCFQCMLPSKLKPSSTHGSIRMEAWVRICKQNDTKLTAKQQSAYEDLQKEKEMLRSVFYEKWKTPGKKLIALGLVEVFEKEKKAILENIEKNKEEEFILQEDQKKVIAQVEQEKHHRVFLLHGVTGSGKTEVFLRLASKEIEKGKQVLLLVPEISLTPQMVKRVKQRFGAHVAIYHSGLNAQEKYEQYQLVKEHKVQIVVGTRSAVFMPFDRLGLIVMDEEHDTSYKQDSTPRYHCRDIAINRGKYHDAKVLLASATPSLESYARAHKGVYALLQMPHRINGNFPSVRIVEMRKSVAKGESYLLSDALLDAIYDRLQKKEQVILLLNRRGYTPILRCISCGYVQMCPHCDVAMSYHKEEKVLKCHTCGYSMNVPTHCPNCHEASWRYLGLGTQKLEEFVQIKFPDARILRMDADTTTRKHAHENLLKSFDEGHADILLGTQMIAKGLDIEKVTLVGIVNGDALLNRSDYRSAEMTYDLLEQASGRSGRGEYKGEVIIQAYDPNHYAIQCAAHHDYLSFFQQEMQYRHLTGYPPYRYLVSMVFSSKNNQDIQQSAEAAMRILSKKENCKILGPAQLHKIRDEERCRILLKGKDEQLLIHYVKDVYDKHLQTKQKARLDIDLSPYMLD
ncbi:replication restart helicase PriA [Amedibacterium intestinale]|uniref:replication restart helicase PriA n=1 Tax=Amedibacterium intestinale TaxID=2583452 RepID=UPI000E53865B|nr:primosomal protein N' [Amedibacterium intestinale]RHO30423.1 primosomal protein N' [Erysipelotrichaceae bacterium AM17-60]